MDEQRKEQSLDCGGWELGRGVLVWTGGAPGVEMGGTRSGLGTREGVSVGRGAGDDCQGRRGLGGVGEGVRFDGELRGHKAEEEEAKAEGTDRQRGKGC